MLSAAVCISIWWPALLLSNKPKIEMRSRAALFFQFMLPFIHLFTSRPTFLAATIKIEASLIGQLNIILMQFKDLHSTPELPWQQSFPPPWDAERSIEYPRRCGRKCSDTDGPLRNCELCGLVSIWILTQSSKVTTILKFNKRVWQAPT